MYSLASIRDKDTNTHSKVKQKNPPAELYVQGTLLHLMFEDLLFPICYWENQKEEPHDFHPSKQVRTCTCLKIRIS